MNQPTVAVFLKRAHPKDIPLLAHINKCLIEDEGHDNPMGMVELQARMRRFLTSGHDGYLVLSGGREVGYILVKSNVHPIYLRHFFIERYSRRHGIGTEAFRCLRTILDTDTIDVEVLHDNQPAIEFWKKMGFQKRFIGLRLNDPRE